MLKISGHVRIHLGLILKMRLYSQCILREIYAFSITPEIESIQRRKACCRVYFMLSYRKTFGGRNGKRIKTRPHISRLQITASRHQRRWNRPWPAGHLKAHADSCVGMAANMIGVTKRIIAFENGPQYMLMYNPEIIKKSAPFNKLTGNIKTSAKNRRRFLLLCINFFF